MTPMFAAHGRPARPCALLRTGALVLCLALFCSLLPLSAPGGTVATVVPTLRAPNAPLLPHLQYFIDETGAMDVEEVTAPANAQSFRPLIPKNLPRSTGVMWLRFTLAPLPAGTKAGTLLLDMGPGIPAAPALYTPHTNPVTESPQWHETIAGSRHVLPLPEAGPEPLTCYIRLDGLPGFWFAPMLRSPQDAATNWSSLAGTAAMLALAVVMLLCLVRGFSEKGQWRVWTALYVAAALAQAVLGMPAYGGGSVGLAVLLPGLALMLLPHVGRHLLRTRGRSRALDAQLALLSLPGALLALLPLFPGFGWIIRYLDLWPACTLMFAPSALGGALMGLGGARRFLLGCLIPPLFVAVGVMGLDHGYAADLLASAPLWGVMLSALLLAGVGLPHDMAPSPAATGDASTAALDAALISARMDDAPITLDQPLDDPNLRLLPPAASARNALSDLSGLPADSARPADSLSGLAPSPDVDTAFWDNLLRPPLDRLMREGAALKLCALPPAVRQHAENMLHAANDLSTIMDNPAKALNQSDTSELRSAFNLQQTVREAHDAVTTRAENAGIGLAWYMPPLLGHMYEGQAQALRETLCLLLESAVRATTRGAVHLAVRRVPESADPGHLLFTVTDTGAGLPPRDRSSLALTRAWELAGANKGYLNVECGPQGTSIAFTLRLNPLEIKEELPKEACEPTIAVVADSAVDRQALAHMITGLGCRSTEARSMHEALQLNREAPALMLVVQFPHDGPAEADALGRFQAEALAAGLPVFKALAITADDSRWDALADCGYTHALLDPADAQAFASTVREVLEEAALHQDSTASPEKPDTTPAGRVAPAAPEAAPQKEPAPPAPSGQYVPLPDLFGPSPATEQAAPPLPDLAGLSDALSLSGPQITTSKTPAQAVLPLPRLFPPVEEPHMAAPAHGPASPAPSDSAAAVDSHEAGAGDSQGAVSESAPRDPAQEEFLASAGLGGLLWPAEPAEEHGPAEEQGPAVEPEGSAPAVADPQPTPPAPLPEQLPLPEQTEPAHEPLAPAAAPGPLEAVLPAEPPAAPPASAPPPPVEAALLPPVDTVPQRDAAPLITISGRIGEATLTPVNAPVPPAPPASPADFAAPAGRGTWADYNLSDEWVGEPMPMGTPVGARPAWTQERSAAPGIAQTKTPQTAARGQYVSPSLSAPGEWVGEPMPIVRDAAQSRPADAAPPTARAEARAAQQEMPRTATGRLILKLLHNAGDRPPSPLPEPAMPPRPQTTSGPDQVTGRPWAGQAPASQANSPASARNLGNSIMNFIAGTAPSAPASPRSAAPHTSGDTLGDTLIRESVAAPAAPASPPLTMAAGRPNLPPAPAQQTDQTLARLVARLDAAMEEAQQGYKNRRSPVVAEAAARIAAESDAHGFRVLARMACCVERAARANDMGALRDLLPELAVAVERNRIALTP